MLEANKLSGPVGKMPGNSSIAILMYHHVADAPLGEIPSRYLYVSASRFRRQMQTLKRLGYIGCSIENLRPYLRGKKTGKVVGITFDDGYQNVHRNALPVLVECGFTATTYFVSRQIGGSNAWDAGYMPYEPCMDLQDLWEWSKMGQEVGGHTRNHPRLTDLAAAEVSDEIAGCRRDLQEMTGQAVDAFSYPFGSHDEAIVGIVGEAGYTTATTTVRNRVGARCDPLRLPRLTVRLSDKLPAFLWKVLR